ncbi:MAG: hypothetical protein Q7U99_04750 [Rubrivivax sp.]|nr:hypothetical protein [Rubrivivax sp.]MDP3225727.1 hypothetical protein [Rubrivivax sp.]
MHVENCSRVVFGVAHAHGCIVDLGCFQSSEYGAAAAFRRDGGGVVENVIVEGGDATT